MKQIFVVAALAIALSLTASLTLAYIENPDAAKAPPVKDPNAIKGIDKAKKIPVIVILKGEKTAAAIQSLEKKAGKVKDPKWDRVLPNGLILEVTLDQLAELEKDPLVDSVSRDEEVHATLETANYWSGATKVRAPTPTGYGVDGDMNGNKYNYAPQDVVIAIVDTGIDPMHIDLNGTNNGGTKKVIGWYDVINGLANPYDDHGHGTHVAAIAAGEGDNNIKYKGVAPGAALVGVKVLNQYGGGSFSSIITGVNWVVTNKAALGIEIMSLSLGSFGSSTGTDALSVAVNNAVTAGLVVTVAAGNDGPQKYTISSPGAAANVITVGAMADPGYLLTVLPAGISAPENAEPLPIGEKKGVKSTGQMSLRDNGFYLAPFSSRGPTASNALKPDVVAPGVYISSADAWYPNSATLHGGYLEMSGTSMSTPFVAGVAALMLDANPALTPALVKSKLTSTAEDWGLTGCDYDYGCGNVRAINAVQSAFAVPPALIPFPNYPVHLRYAGTFMDTYGYLWTNVPITNDGYPLALTLIMYDWSGGNGYDLDMYVTDPNGYYEGGSAGVNRQETISIAPTMTGTHTAYMTRWFGSGRYAWDITKK